MKFLSLIIVLCLLVPAGFAQEHKAMRPRHIQKKMEELEKIKLLEVLQADEETTVRFFSRRKEHTDKMKALEDSRDEKLNQLAKLVENDVNNEELKRKISEIQGIDQELAQARQKYIGSLQEILNFQQIAKVLLFERNFREELREIILKERKRRN